MVVFFMNMSLVKANSGIMRKRSKVWLYELKSQYGKYIMVVNYYSFFKNSDFYEGWFNYLRITYDCFLCLSPISLGHVSSKVPSCVARMSVTPSFGEQPDSSTPRCSYSWLKGSRVQNVNTETSYRFLLMHFWCFNSKVLSGMVVFFMNLSLAKANSGLMRKRNKV